jgi:hypothetical protein
MKRKLLLRSPVMMIFLMLMLAAAQGWAVSQVWAADGVEVRLIPERSELTVGDPLQLTLEVTHPAGTQVIIPQLDPVWGDLEVRNQSPATTVANEDGTETTRGTESTRQVIEVTLFDLGEFETPTWSVTIRDEAGQVFEEAIPTVTLEVVPTLDAEDNELRDIKPQAGLAVPPTWPWIAGGLLFAVTLTAGGWWAYRRWRGQPFLAPAIDTRSPRQVAYDELARIEGLGLVEQDRFKAYYTLVTDCLRTYLEQEFGLPVFEHTTSELRILFRGSRLAPEQSRRFLDLFAESDLVKFAKFRPGPETARALLGEARELVTVTSEEATAQDSQQASSGQAGNRGGHRAAELEAFFREQPVDEEKAPATGPRSAVAPRLGTQPGR